MYNPEHGRASRHNYSGSQDGFAICRTDQWRTLSLGHARSLRCCTKASLQRTSRLSAPQKPRRMSSRDFAFRAERRSNPRKLETIDDVGGELFLDISKTLCLLRFRETNRHCLTRRITCSVTLSKIACKSRLSLNSKARLRNI